MKSSDAGGNYYGSTTRVETSEERDISRQTFSISEPSYNEVLENGSRNGPSKYHLGSVTNRPPVDVTKPRFPQN